MPRGDTSALSCSFPRRFVGIASAFAIVRLRTRCPLTLLPPRPAYADRLRSSAASTISAIVHPFQQRGIPSCCNCCCGGPQPRALPSSRHPQVQAAGGQRLRVFFFQTLFAVAARVGCRSQRHVTDAIPPPPDYVRVALQATSPTSASHAMPFASFLGAVKHTHAREGVRGFYRGFGVTLIGAVAHGMSHRVS